METMTGTTLVRGLHKVGCVGHGPEWDPRMLLHLRVWEAC